MAAMPIGTYRVMDGEGADLGFERFRSAPGPAGWRYFSEIERRALPRLGLPERRETVDLTVDRDWRPVRLRVQAGERTALAVPRGDVLDFAIDGDTRDLPWTAQTEVDFLSPSFNAVTANRLGTGTTDLDVVFLDPVTLEPSMVRQRYEALGPGTVTTPAGTFEAARWRYSSLGGDTFTRDFWLAGDTVVAYDTVFELVEYEPGANGPRPLA
jgi:hypothetical protein